MESPSPVPERRQSVAQAFNFRRGTVLANADFKNLEVWEEDETQEHRENQKDDYAAADDYEFDDSLRYTRLNFRHTFSDLWDYLRCRKFYRIEGDKFYYVRTLAVRRGSIIELCLHDGHPYIVKRIPLHGAPDLVKAADQFNNLRNYDHPHVLFAYKAGIGNSPTWTNWTRTEVRFLLPFVQGHLLSIELADRRKNNMYIHPRRIVRLLREILDGLFEIHSHSNGDAHRDMRPGTIMIRSPDDWPVILDLDACTPAVIITTDEEEVQHMIEISETVTSPYYRAPETFDIKPESIIDERTDIWAMGCTLYAMCFFRSPFQPPDTDDISPDDLPYLVKAQIRHNIMNLTTSEFLENMIPSNSPYPRELHEFMARMLSVDLSGRPTTEQIIRELDETIASLGGPDQPICVKYPWINPGADEMAADVLKRRIFTSTELKFDEMHPELASYVYMEDRAQSLGKAGNHKHIHNTGVLESLRMSGGNFLFDKHYISPYASNEQPKRKQSIVSTMLHSLGIQHHEHSHSDGIVKSKRKSTAQNAVQDVINGARKSVAGKTSELRPESPTAINPRRSQLEVHIHAPGLPTITEDQQEHQQEKV